MERKQTRKPAMYNYYMRRKVIIIVIALFVLIAFAVGAGAYYYVKSDDAVKRMSDIDTEDYSVKALSVQSENVPEPVAISITQVSKELIGDDIYMTPIGFPIISYSEKWQGNRLVEIYDELLSNTHGDEINYISKVVVKPGLSAMGTADSVIAGTHSTTQKRYMVFFDVPLLVSSSMEYAISSKQSVIELYGMDEYDTIEQAAKTISHEYGHHFTIFYFLQSDELAEQSQYYRLRNIDEFTHPIFYSNQRDYLENHQWSIYELAAEDYVQLLGSKNAKQVKFYMDIYDALHKSDGKDYFATADQTTSNVFPQENFLVPLAEQVDGLRDYYCSLIDVQNKLPPLETVDFDIRMEKRNSYGNTYYDSTWDNVYGGKNVLYTLVCFDKDYNIFSPIKTLLGNEKPVAKVGTVSLITGDTLTTYTNTVTDEDRYFRLHVMLPDGRIIASQFFFADF